MRSNGIYKYKSLNADSNLSNCISIITSAQEVMFSLVPAPFCWLVGRLVGLFVCLSVGLLRNYRMDFRTWMEDGSKPRINPN